MAFGKKLEIQGKILGFVGVQVIFVSDLVMLFNIAKVRAIPLNFVLV